MFYSLLILLPYLFGCSVAILVLSFIPPWASVLGKKKEVGSYVFPAVAGGLLIIAAIYYTLCFGFPRYSIIRLAGFEVKIKSMCHRRHPRFGYKYRVFIIPIDDSQIGHMARLLRWCFGWALDSPTARVDPGRASQVWLEQHGSGIQGCTCQDQGVPLVEVPPVADTQGP